MVTEFVGLQKTDHNRRFSEGLAIAISTKLDSS